MKNVEEFIRSNRSALDDKQPSEKIWKNINQTLFGKQVVMNALVYWRAAAILFMALSAVLLYSNLSESRSNHLVLNEFKDVENFYIKEISNKVEMIETFSGAESVLNGFTHDFNQLEAMYEVLKDEMKANPSEKVKDALVLNLLVRIDLLNKQLEKLDSKEKQIKKEEDQDKQVVSA